MIPLSQDIPIYIKCLASPAKIHILLRCMWILTPIHMTNPALFIQLFIQIFLGLMHMAALWLHFVLVYLKFHTEEYRIFFCRNRKSDRKIKKCDVSGNNPACWWSTVCKGFFTLLKTVQREFKLDVIFYDNIANPDKKIKPLSTFKIGYKILLIKYISISLSAL